MAAWNLALRFGLELAALAGLGAAGWNLTSGLLRWVLAILVPVAAATVWGVFNVPDDPSRSGAAPVEVAGWVRLGLELVILGGAAVIVYLVVRHDLGIVFAVLIGFHYATSTSRIDWLIHR